MGQELLHDVEISNHQISCWMLRQKHGQKHGQSKKDHVVSDVEY